MKVMIVKEVITGDVSPVAVFLCVIFNLLDAISTRLLALLDVYGFCVLCFFCV